MLACMLACHARHGLNLVECEGVRVLGLRIARTGGDGLYLYRATNVEVRDVVTDSAYRNGLSVISASDVVVAGCRFLYTSGTAPEAGIDIEPNTPTATQPMYVLSNITFIDIESRYNVGSGITFALGKLGPTAAPSISVTNMVIIGCAGAGDFCSSTLSAVTATGAAAATSVGGAASAVRGTHGSGGDVMDYNVGVMVVGRSVLARSRTGWQAGFITMDNITVTNTVQPGLEVETKLPGDMQITLRRCTFENVGRAALVRWGGQNVPLLLHESSAHTTIGGVAFEDCVVNDTQPRPFLKCDSCSSRGHAVNISGSMRVRNPHGCTLDLGNDPDNTTLRYTCNKTTALPAPPAPSAPKTPLGMIVPLYVDPGAVWERLARSAQAHAGKVQITAIISPNHGDNDANLAGDDIPRYLAHNKTWLDGMAMLRQASRTRLPKQQNHITCVPDFRLPAPALLFS